MSLTPTLEFGWSEADPGSVLDAMAGLTGSGRGWINLRPEITAENEPPPRSIASWLFSARGEPVPLITWAPEADGRGSVGIEHGSGARALHQLADAGHDLPDGWLRRADHARRGLVVETPSGTDVAEVLRWAVHAAHLLTRVPLTGEWLASVYETRR